MGCDTCKHVPIDILPTMLAADGGIDHIKCAVGKPVFYIGSHHRYYHVKTVEGIKSMADIAEECELYIDR